MLGEGEGEEKGEEDEESSGERQSGTRADIANTSSSWEDRDGSGEVTSRTLLGSMRCPDPDDDDDVVEMEPSSGSNLSSDSLSFSLSSGLPRSSGEGIVRRTPRDNPERLTRWVVLYIQGGSVQYSQR